MRNVYFQSKITLFLLVLIELAAEINEATKNSFNLHRTNFCSEAMEVIDNSTELTSGLKGLQRKKSLHATFNV